MSNVVKKELKIDGMTCVSCENRIERKLQNTPGILEAKVSYASGTANVKYDVCWMGMIRSRITVVDDIDSASETTPVPKSDEAAYRIPTDEIALAIIEDGVQYVEISIDENGFSPAVAVMQGEIETEWVINARSQSGINSVLLFPQYYAQLEMEEGENVITLVPEGDFDFSTADASFFGYAKVVDDITAVDLDAIRQEIDQYIPVFWDVSDESAFPASCH